MQLYGTESILQGREGFLYSSVHQSPGYPDTGEADRDNSRNWPVRPDTPRERHMEALRASWEAVLAFRPGLVLVSAGFDAYAGDPITDMTLEVGDFGALGSWIRASALPAAAVSVPSEIASQNREVVQAVKAVNGSEMFGQDEEFAFQMDSATKRLVVQVINRNTKEVISQVPAEYVLRMAQDIKSP